VLIELFIHNSFGIRKLSILKALENHFFELFGGMGDDLRENKVTPTGLGSPNPDFSPPSESP
jgi:hypothetical protein